MWDGEKMRILDQVFVGVGQLGFSDGHYVDLTMDDKEAVTLMQYTGRKDKNDVEIYEGDIVLAIAKASFNDETRTSDIIYNQNLDIGNWQVRSGKEYNHGLSISWGGWESIEVIGNIKQNLELLNKD
jgi:uncharacterized phage protein (TIGR01671 family)